MELALRGVSAAPGVAFGSAVVLGREGYVDHEIVVPERRGAELESALRALKATAADLEAIAATLRRIGRPDEADMVETGILMASDPGLIARVEGLVLETGRPAAQALREAAEQSADQLAQLSDRFLAERADDVRSLGRRAVAFVLGAAKMPAGVLIASSLGPADVADLSLMASGVVLAGGGVTAHAAIVARSLGIPMIVGLGAAVFDVENGEEVVIDGDAGVLVRHPDRDRIATAVADGDRRRMAREAARAQRDEPAVTRDGRRVTVLVNAASAAEMFEGTLQGAEGVGLLRTELGFLDASAWPSADQQTTFLKPILDHLKDKTATVRLLDFGGDKTPPFLRGDTGRGIELLLESPQALTAQLTAILEAGRDTKLRILVPMVTSASQVRAVRQVLDAILDGQPSPLIGAMIETPEAASRAAEIAKECDFLSLGTNDLTQLVLGLDREHSKTAPVTDIRVLRLIDATMRAGRGAGITVDVCGEAASDRSAMAVMVGLGADELSVAAARVGEVRQRVRELSFAACREESEKLLGQAGHTGRQGV